MATQKIIETEQQLRNFISEILNPFNARVMACEKHAKDIEGKQDFTRQRMQNIEQKLDSDSKLRHDLIEVEKHGVMLVRFFVTNRFVGKIMCVGQANLRRH